MYGHRSEQDKALAFHKKRMLLQVALLLLDWSCLFIQSFKVSFQGGSFVTWKSGDYIVGFSGCGSGILSPPMVSIQFSNLRFC